MRCFLSIYQPNEIKLKYLARRPSLYKKKNCSTQWVLSVREQVRLVPVQIQYIFAQPVRADASFGIYFFLIGRNETRHKGEKPNNMNHFYCFYSLPNRNQYRVNLLKACFLSHRFAVWIVCCLILCIQAVNVVSQGYNCEIRHLSTVCHCGLATISDGHTWRVTAIFLPCWLGRARV